MSHGFGRDGAAGHKSESVNEIGKLVLAMKFPSKIVHPLSSRNPERIFVLSEFGRHWPYHTNREGGCLFPCAQCGVVPWSKKKCRNEDFRLKAIAE
jgi:hypothetical protein